MGKYYDEYDISFDEFINREIQMVNNNRHITKEEKGKIIKKLKDIKKEDW